MAVITIGPGATDRTQQTGSGSTLVEVGGTADGDGTLNTFEIWVQANATGVKAGTLSGSGTAYTSRDVETLGNVTSGSKQTFSGLDCDVLTGDFAGYYMASGNHEVTSSGQSGTYYKSGDQFGAGEQTYALLSGWATSIYGTGTDAAAGWSHKYLGVANAAIGKINGVAIASILKVKGVE